MNDVKTITFGNTTMPNVVILAGMINTKLQIIACYA